MSLDIEWEQVPVYAMVSFDDWIGITLDTQ